MGHVQEIGALPLVALEETRAPTHESMQTIWRAPRSFFSANLISGIPFDDGHYRDHQSILALGPRQALVRRQMVPPRLDRVAASGRARLVRRALAFAGPRGPRRAR